MDEIVVPAGFPRTARSSSWPALPYASALLVLVALGVIFLMYATPRVSPLRPPISGNTPAETLLEITLPAEALPHGARVSGALKDYSLDPGLDAAWEPVAGACCPGLRLTYVIGGSLSMSSAATAHVLRGGMSLAPEMVPAGGAVELGPGDAFVSRFDIAFFSKNPGDVPARFLDISFIDGFFPLDAVPNAWVWHPDVDEAYGLSLPEQPAILRLDQVVLEPGATLLPAPGTYTQLGVTIADNEPIETCGKDAIKNNNDKPVTVHVAMLLPVGAASLPALPEEPDPACVGAVPLEDDR